MSAASDAPPSPFSGSSVLRRLAPIVIMLVSLFIARPVLGQRTVPDSVKYWVFFDAKDSAAEPTQATGGEYAPGKTRVRGFTLSQEALNRRHLRATRNAGTLDLPVNARYVDVLERQGFHPVHRSRWLNAVSVWLTPANRRTITALPFVRRISPVGSTQVETTESGQRYLADAAKSPRRFTYGFSRPQLERINAIGNIEQGIAGQGVRLGIIDTGIGDLNVAPAFARLLAENRLIESRDFTGQPDDGSRHALGVLSTMVGFDDGQLIGPAYLAEVLHARTEYVATETNQEEDNLVAGLEWMESKGVDVVNISLGYSVFDSLQSSYTYDDMDGNTAVTTIAVDIAASLGVVVVTSAGNDGSCPPPDCWYYITSPADADSSITVGALDTNDQRATFSSFGPTSDGRIKPDISAPGVNVIVANNLGTYSSWGGTSVSSPLVAAVVAQMLQVRPDLAPMQILDIIRETARIPLDEGRVMDTFPNNALGWGIIDAGRAVQVAKTTSIENTPSVPESVLISEPYPNPASNIVSFSVDAEIRNRNMDLGVYDLLGRKVIEKHFSTGTGPRISLTVDQLPAGFYFIRVRSGDRASSGSFSVVH